MQLKINGINVNFEYVKKSDKTIVFLHGWGGGISSFKAGFDYFFNNSEYSLLNIDLPPFGESDEPLKNFTIYDYYELVKTLIFKLKIKSINIISHSFGGRIAILLASKKEVKVESLILIASAGIKAKKSLKTRFEIISYKFKKKFSKNSKKLNKMGSRDYRLLSNNMKQVFVNVVNENLKKYLKNITCKTLIIWAKDDYETPKYMAKILNKKIKNSGLIMFNDGGHFCYLKYHTKFVKAAHYLFKS